MLRLPLGKNPCGVCQWCYISVASKHLKEKSMELKNEADHVAILSLMMVGVLTKRLIEIGQLDSTTAAHLHKLVQGVRIHAKAVGLTDLNSLFNNIDDKLSEHKG